MAVEDMRAFFRIVAEYGYLAAAWIAPGILIIVTPFTEASRDWQFFTGLLLYLVAFKQMQLDDRITECKEALELAKQWHEIAIAQEKKTAEALLDAKRGIW